MTKPYSNILVLDSECRQIVLGSILGDAHVSARSAVSALIAFTHCERQREYLEWKYKRLKEAGLVTTYIHETVEHGFPQLKFWTICHPSLKVYREMFYPDGRKSINPQILQELEPLGLAVWYMDDGSYHKSHNATVTVKLSTDAFSPQENSMIVDWFQQKYNLYLHYNGHHLILSRFREAVIFFDLVRPFILPSMAYKIEHNELARRNPQYNRPEWREKISVRTIKYRQTEEGEAASIRAGKASWESRRKKEVTRNEWGQFTRIGDLVGCA